MDGLLLNKAEFLVLLDAAQAQTVIGLDVDALVPDSPAEQRAIVQQGHTSLQERGLLQKRDDGVVLLDPVLLTLATVLSRPEMVIVVLRHHPERGNQQCTIYQREAYIVEHTMPDSQTHRLATWPNLGQVVLRIAQLLPLVHTTEPALGVINEATFLQAKTQAESNETNKAHAVLSAALDTDAATSLVEAMQKPLFSGSVAILRCVDQEVVDARSLAVLQGLTSAWIIQQRVAGVTDLEIKSSDQTVLATLVQQWFSQLSQK